MIEKIIISTIEEINISDIYVYKQIFYNLQYYFRNKMEIRIFELMFNRLILCRDYSNNVNQNCYGFRNQTFIRLFIFSKIKYQQRFNTKIYLIKYYMQKIGFFINKFIISQYKFVVSIAGCGAKFLQSMTYFCGSSKLFLQGTNSYSVQSLKHYIKKQKIQKCCSQQTTSLQADYSFYRAQQLLFNSINNKFQDLDLLNMKSAIGIGLNGSLSTNYEKKGPIQCFVSIRKYNYKRNYHIKFIKSLGRVQEEQIIMNLTHKMINSVLFKESDDEIYNYSEILQIQKKQIKIEIFQHQTILLPSMYVNPILKNVSIFTGSFNPFHLGHYQIYQISQNHHLLKNMPFLFQLTLKNADKPQNTNIYERISTILHVIKQKHHDYTNQQIDQQKILKQLKKMKILILLSRKGKFIDKGLSQGYFIVGAQTYKRINDLKFYNNDVQQLNKVILNFNYKGIKFLVYNRVGVDNQLIKIEDIGVKYEVVNDWRKDISSTELRNMKKQ